MALIETNNVVDGAAGIGNPLRNAGAPTNGTSGTGAGKAPTGAKLIDTTNGIDYINTGTQASPVWTKVGTQT
jgi:hypothetical protein